MIRLTLPVLVLLAVSLAARADVTLVDNGQANCAIVADAAVMAADRSPAPTKFAEAEAERQRQRLRESVKDLAHYLGKMSGTKVDVLTTPPLRTFRYQPDPDKKGEAAGWAKPEFEDRRWRRTDVCTETWSTLDYHDYFKSMWYRTDVTVPAGPAGKKVFLWLGSFDGSAKVFVNGRHVPHVDAKGKATDEVTGYCQPFSFDVTAAVKPGAKNTLAIFCTRTAFNELGTGGLIGPVVVYRERP